MNKDVLQKLAKIESKVELAEVRVDLSLMDDFRSALTGLVQEPSADNSNKVIAMKKDLQRRIDDAKVILTRVPKVIQAGMQLEKAVKDLGVDLPPDYGAAKDRLFREEQSLKNNIEDWTAALSKMIGR